MRGDLEGLKATIIVNYIKFCQLSSLDENMERCFHSSQILAEEEAVLKGIGRVYEELMAASDVGCACNLGDYGPIRAELDCSYDPAGKTRSKDAFDHKGLINADFAPGVMESGASTDPSPSGASVNFPLSKNTHVAAVMAWISSFASEYCPV